MPVIVDGYNLLRSVQQSDDQFETLDEVGMCRMISEYLRRVRDHGHIVFDGIGPRDKTNLGGLGNLEVYFSGASTDADTIIEERIEANTAPKSLIIISTDRRLRAAAGKRKAMCVRSEMFWPSLMRQLEKSGKRRPEPREKHDGINENETDEWLDFFGL